MLTPVVFLPLAAVLINDVRTEVKDGALTVEIATSEAVATSDIRVATGGQHRLYVYLDGSEAKQSTFGEGAGAIVAHPRARYTKLEIPTVERCGEPIGVVRTEDGLRVRAACRDASSAKASASAPARVAGALDVERPLPDAPQAARTREAQSQSALRAALALPTESSAGDTVPRLEPNSKLVADSGKAKANTVAKEEPREAPKVAPPKHVDVEAPVPAAASQDGPDGSIKGTGNEKSSSSSLTTILAVALLAGLGIVTLVFARRKGKRERVIRIVETASIGPRRSLVVASVGGRTMVLGVSEAGVSLLDASAALPSAADVPKPTETIADAALGLRNFGLPAAEPAPESSAEDKQESSLLSRLFRRKPRETEGLGRQDFEQLFAESMEDEELRRKLALGQSGRIA